MSDDSFIGRRGGEINHDQVRAEPTRGANGESGIVFFADGIFTRSFKSTPHDARDSGVMIEEKNFFQHLHKLALFRASVMPVKEGTAPRQWSATARSQSASSHLWRCARPISNLAQ